MIRSLTQLAAGTLLLVLVALLFFLAWGAGGSTGSSPEIREMVQLEPPETPIGDLTQLRVLAFEAEHGQLVDSLFDARERSHARESLRRFAQQLHRMRPDIIVLWDWPITGPSVHDLWTPQELGAQLDLPWSAALMLHEKNWVPIPFWPPGQQLGPTRSGLVILSRLPIVEDGYERRVPENAPLAERLWGADRGTLCVRARTSSQSETRICAFDDIADERYISPPPTASPVHSSAVVVARGAPGSVCDDAPEECARITSRTGRLRILQNGGTPMMRVDDENLGGALSYPLLMTELRLAPPSTSGDETAPPTDSAAPDDGASDEEN